MFSRRFIRIFRIKAWAFSSRRSRLSSRKRISAYDWDSVRTLSPSWRTSNRETSFHRLSYCFLLWTWPSRFCTTASAGTSWFSILILIAFLASLAADFASLMEVEYSPDCLFSSAASRKSIALAVISGAKILAPALVACWISFFEVSSSLFALNKAPAGIKRLIPGWTSWGDFRSLARSMFSHWSGSWRYSFAISRIFWFSLTFTVITSLPWLVVGYNRPQNERIRLAMKYISTGLW